MTSPATEPLEELLNVQEVCTALNVKPDWLYDQVQAKKLRAIRLGRRSLRFRRADVRAFVDNLADGGTEL